MTFGKRVCLVLDLFRTVLVVFLAVAVLLFVHSDASVLWAIAAAVGKLLLLAVTAVVGWSGGRAGRAIFKIAARPANGRSTS